MTLLPTLSDWWIGCNSLIYFGEKAARLAPDPFQIAMPDDDFRSRVAAGLSSGRPRLVGAHFPGKWTTRATVADAVNHCARRACDSLGKTDKGLISRQGINTSAKW